MSSLPDSHRDLVGPPSEVQVTVLRLPDDHLLYRRVGRQLERIPTRVRQAVIATLGLVALGGFVLAVALGAGGRRDAIWGVTEPGAAGVAAAYGYPLGCLRVRISAANPAFARAEFDRRGSCGYVSGFASATFRRFNGEWHPVLYSIGSG
jgi:hypothetical protein